MTALDRFEAKYEPEPMSGCWVWHGAQNQSSPGRMSYGYYWDSAAGKLIAAHRWSAKHVGGLAIEDGQVNHRCDNGLCVNPDHLYIGTQRDNIMDSVQRMRRRGTRKMSEDMIRSARGLYDSGEWTHRQIAERFGVHRSTITWVLRHQA